MRISFLPLTLALALPLSAAEPLTLDQAMKTARERAREVTAAGARKNAAEERVRQAQGFRLPSLTFSETYVKTNSPAEAFAMKLNKNQFSFPEFVQSDPNDPGYSSTAITRIEAMVPLFTGGELSGRIKQAESAASAAAKSRDWASDGAAYEAANAYIMVSQAEEFVKLLTKARETVKAHVDLANSYVNEGMLVRSELLRAQVELARVEDMLADAKGKVRVAQANLAFRLGAAQDTPFELAPLPSPPPATSRERKDLSAGRDLLAAGELEEKVKRSGYFPKAGVLARYDLVGTNLFGSSGDAGTVMAFVSWNLFSGGSDKAAIVAAREEARAGREDIARFTEGVALETRQAYEEAMTARERHKTALLALDSARETERIMKERFSSGVVKILDVLDASTARREAETRELTARADAHAASYRLALKAGRAPESVLTQKETK
ncbi:MAG: TolC family protein [Thermoanaerobaculia bacterium]|nr:TolC family protein [Thermoanaerobaculia bacterium]